MELSSQEAGEIPIPINSTYGGGGNGHGHGHGHMIHHHHHAAAHNHIIPASSSSPPLPQNQIPSINGPLSTNLEDNNNGSAASNVKKLVKYKECLKNHAAAMGGNATDGCGEFMPGGEEGTLEALTCSACNCHRNFHRKEIEGEQQAIAPFDFYHHHNPHHHLNRVGRKVILGHHKNILAAAPEGLAYPTATGTLISSRAAAPTPQQMIMSYNMGSLPSESDEQEDGVGVGGGVIMAAASARPTAQHLVKKRFRTKFTQEQKEKMLNFAEKVGWKIQKQEESVVQQFCQEIGVKRRVLKVWMHNNKHNLAKKINNPPSTTTA